MTGTRGGAAVFIDKDGTLLVDVPFNVDPDRMQFTDGAERALQALTRTGLPLIVVSNQSGIAHGLFEEQAMEAVERRLDDMFADCGAKLAGFYYCPHHPAGLLRAYTCACACRKPEPGMLFRAAVEHAVEPSSSWMVGDILDDVEAGRRAGCTTILLDNGNETEWALSPRRTPHHAVGSLDEAASLIVSSHTQQQTA
jgi:D-glycero-D-manno-heptose 1,7-bisphosphate phosphatase